MTQKEEIISKAIEIIKNKPNGIQYRELGRALRKMFLNTPISTILRSIWDLHVKKPNEIYKPARGLFKHLSLKRIGEPLEVKKINFL